jgi:hypothetical protein
MAKRSTRSRAKGRAGEPTSDPVAPVDRSPREQSIEAGPGAAADAARAQTSARDAGEGVRPRPAAAAAEPQPSTRPSGPTEDEIRHRAYLRYLARGGAHGADLDDWFTAERELRAQRENRGNS